MRLFTTLLVALMIACSGKVQTVRSIDQTQVMCGTVQFANACGPKTDSLLALGIALYHHMTFEEARENFRKAIEADPNCMWGYWGVALSYLHPIWPDVPSDEMRADGMQNARLAARRASDQREKLFSNALLAYYDSREDYTESQKLKAYEEGWAQAFEAMPYDLEAKSFYILSHLSVAEPGDKTYANQLKAGALAESILEDIPDHPAGFHYVIHAYDFPPLAQKGLGVARGYGNIAPDIPHALHMPTHIFTRLGYWDESIEWNTRSAEAALNYPIKGAVSLHHFHALDYLAYAYLQKGQDDLAIEVSQKMTQLSPPWQVSFPTAYALAAIPARIALERKDWEAAADLKPRQPDHYDWDKFPEFEAMLEFARAIGAARSGDLDKAEASIQHMSDLQEKVVNTSKNAYWEQQIEIQKLAASAWVAYSRGNEEEAVKLMKQSAEMESLTSKNPVTPGEVLPARELLGDMYADLGMHAEAVESYDLALERSPNRFNSLLGAMNSSREIGDSDRAQIYEQKLRELTAESTSPRTRISDESI